jgi:hypothetical protein
MLDQGSPQKADLEELKRLTNLYAQSRVLPTLIVLVLFPTMLAGTLLIHHLVGVFMGVIDEPPWVKFRPALRATGFLTLFAWWLVCLWLMAKGVKRYGPSFYRGEGQAVLHRKGMPIWAWALLAVMYLGPAILSIMGVLAIRWALATGLASFGFFMLYAGKRNNEMPFGIVFGGLCLVAAIATAAGLPTLEEGDFRYAYFVTLTTYIVGAGAVTTIVVHAYNRRILRRLKETMR